MRSGIETSIIAMVGRKFRMDSIQPATSLQHATTLKSCCPKHVPQALQNDGVLVCDHHGDATHTMFLFQSLTFASMRAKKKGSRPRALLSHCKSTAFCKLSVTPPRRSNHSRSGLSQDRSNSRNCHYYILAPP